MLRLAGYTYENIEFQSPLYSIDQPCETVYLIGLFEKLRSLMGAVVAERHFIIFSGPDSRMKGPPSRRCSARGSEPSSRILLREGLIANLHSLPLGYVGSIPDYPPVPVNDRRQNVFFSGNLNGNRITMFKALATPRLSPVPLPPRILSLLNPSLTCDKYVPCSYIRFTNGFRRVMRSRVRQTPRGQQDCALPRAWHSTETVRHFEAMRAGAIVVSEELPPLRFYLGSPIVTISSWYTVRALISEILASPKALIERQQRTLAWWQDVCSEAATATRIADVTS